MKKFKQYIKESDLDVLKKELFKLNRKVFKVMPSSPLQKSIQQKIKELKEQLKKLGYDYDKVMIDYIDNKIKQEKEK